MKKSLKRSVGFLAASFLFASISVCNTINTFRKTSNSAVVAMGTCNSAGTQELEERLASVSANLTQLNGASASSGGVPGTIEAQTYPFEGYAGPRVAVILSDGMRDILGREMTGGSTGFLIGGGYVVTAAHALPPTLSYRPEEITHYANGGFMVVLEQGSVDVIAGDRKIVTLEGQVIGLASYSGHATEAKVAKGPDIALVYAGVAWKFSLF